MATGVIENALKVINTHVNYANVCENALSVIRNVTLDNSKQKNKCAY